MFAAVPATAPNQAAGFLRTGLSWRDTLAVCAQRRYVSYRAVADGENRETSWEEIIS